MNAQLYYGSLKGDRETARLGEILAQCFNIASPEYWEYFSTNIGLENFRSIHQSDRIAGGLALLQMEQWFGGKPIPMTGIAAVGVLPEYRGTGMAKALMSQTLQEIYSSGVPISVLYAATQRPYRQAGYEQAGIYCLWEIATEAIGINQSDRTLSVDPVPLDIEQFSELHQQWASRNNGNLARTPLMWKLLLAPPGEKVFAYRLGTEGYLIFRQTSEPNPQLIVQDWVALTPRAIRRLWTFFRDHRSQIATVQWCGALVEPLQLALLEQTEKIKKQERWMMRIVDVAKALSLRGYPVGVTGELHLEIEDELLEENRDRFILSVEDGKAEVTRGGKGEVKMDIRALAPLYTGLFSASQLQRLGYVEANERSLSLATQFFAGSEPWMPDKF